MNDILIIDLLGAPDVVIRNGDFLVGEAKQQATFLTLATNKGDFRANPDVGLSLASYVNSEDQDVMLAEITRLLEADGFTINSLGFENGQLKLDVTYEDR